MKCCSVFPFLKKENLKAILFKKIAKVYVKDQENLIFVFIKSH